MSQDPNSIDLKTMQEKAIKQLLNGESLYGSDGAFAPLLKQFLEAAMQAELDAHISESTDVKGNRKNGRMSKVLKTGVGSIDIDTPRDRNATFEPQILKKRETILADSLEKKIIGMYGLGMSFRDISSHIKEMYDTDISHTTLSTITDRIIPEVREWQSRELDSFYTLIWMDAMHYKVRQDDKISSRAVYNILGINRYGKKELLGMYVSQSEGASFWLNVLTDLQNRGVNDILIACIDNLKGFAEAIEHIFPKTDVQICIVHQIRNSIKYIAKKDNKEFMDDLKLVYKADTLDLAELNLDHLEDKWGKKYPIVISSWRRNWTKLSCYFNYEKLIRKMMYTTNPIEGFHRQVRKVTKTKGAFTSDMALLKLIYLAQRNISKKWTQPIKEWKQIIQRLAIKFPDRMIVDIN